MQTQIDNQSFSIGDRVAYIDDDDNTQHLATVLRIDKTLLLAFDDGDEGWESATACRHLCVLAD